MPKETTTKEALEPKADDDPHRWEVEPHPYSTDFDIFITDSDVVARAAILEAAEMYLWDGNEGEERTLTVRMNKDIPNAVSTFSAPIAPVVDDNDRVLLEALRRVRADQDDFWTFYQGDPLMVKAADRIEELLRWHSTEQSMHAAWRKRAEEAEATLAAPASTVAPQQSEGARVTQERDDLSNEMGRCHEMLARFEGTHEEGMVCADTLEECLQRHLDALTPVITDDTVNGDD